MFKCSNSSLGRFLAIAILSALSCNVFAASDSRKIVTALDGNCIQNSEDFTAIDRHARLVGWKDVTQEMRQADAVIYKLGGRAYKASENGFKYMVSYAIGGGCSIMVPDLDAGAVIDVLKKNYRFSKVIVDSEGMQVTRTFFLAPSTYIPGGMIYVISPKPDTGYKHGTVGFVPAAATALKN